MKVLARVALAVSIALGAMVVVAQPAAANHHFMSLTQVFIGTLTTAGDAQFIEMQMYAAGQRILHDHVVFVYDASGAEIDTFTFVADVPSGANQRRVLIATPAAETMFGLQADLEMDAASLPAAGGKVCFEAVDCVAWGNYSGSSVGVGAPFSPVDGLLVGGSAMRRDISAGNAALLEAADDTGDSAADFDPAPPAPRNNANTLGAPTGGSVGIAPPTATTAEGGGTDLTVQRSGATAAASVDIDVVLGTASEGDVTVSPSTVVFGGGATTATVTVDGVPDATAEPDESLTIRLRNPTGGMVFDPSTTAVTITDVPPPIDPAPPADFDGDGDTDRSVFRPSTGRWFTHEVAGSVALGVATDVPVPGDYDGDGDTDRAVFRPSNGRWYTQGVAGSVLFGANGDIPVPGDYNGDGSTERAVFRPSNGRWYIHGTPGSVLFNVAGGVPVPGNYDGDGDTDIAIYRPSTGAWFTFGSPGSVVHGIAGDVPVPGDYDGDGDTDRAVFRPSNGRWYTSGVAGSVAWGVNGDIPVPGEYTGDGGVDRAVFRPSNGRWYVQGLAGSVALGVSTDTPLPLPAAIERHYFP